MRVLYLTFYTYPLNNIASFRTNGFLHYLPEMGVEIDVLTRYYDTSHLSGNAFRESFAEVNELKSDYLQKDNVIWTNFKRDHKRERRALQLPFGLRPIYNFINVDVYHEGWTDFALNAFEEKLANKKYDFIIASYSPITTFRVASIISKKYQIPWIAEFRDIFVGLRKEALPVVLWQRFLQWKLLKGCSGVVAVCPGIEDFFRRYAIGRQKTLPVKIVNNGIDENIKASIDEADKEVAAQFMEIKQKSDLVFLHTGTVYQGQDIDFFMQCIEKLRGDGFNVKLILVGLTEDQRINFEGDHVKVLGRVKNSTSLYFQKNADALILPAWYPERYTGFIAKVFEYIHYGKLVLCSPKPVKDLEEFISKFENVQICKNYEMVKNAARDLVNSRVLTAKENNDPRLYRKYWIQELKEFLYELKNKKW